MKKKHYDGIAIEPVYLDGEEVIVTSGCVSSFDVNAEGAEPPSANDTFNTADFTSFDICGKTGLAPGFYTMQEYWDYMDAHSPVVR